MEILTCNQKLEDEDEHVGGDANVRYWLACTSDVLRKTIPGNGLTCQAVDRETLGDSANDNNDLYNFYKSDFDTNLCPSCIGNCYPTITNTQESYLLIVIY